MQIQPQLSVPSPVSTGKLSPAGATTTPPPAKNEALSNLDTVSEGLSVAPVPLTINLTSLPDMAQRVEQAVQDLWNATANPGKQAAILGQFQQDLNQTAMDTVPPTFVYSESDLLAQDQVLQQRIQKIQERLDDGTPDCGGGMTQELTACQLAQHGLQQALQVRYLHP